MKAPVRQSASKLGCWLKIPLASSDHFLIPSAQTSPSTAAGRLSLDFVPILTPFAFVELMQQKDLAFGPRLFRSLWRERGRRRRAEFGLSANSVLLCEEVIFARLRDRRSE